MKKKKSLAPIHEDTKMLMIGLFFRIVHPSAMMELN